MTVAQAELAGSDPVTATRRWFVQTLRDCIVEARSGVTFVNDLAAYVAWREEGIREVLAGAWDHCFAFQQRLHFLQTGECVALLAPPTEHRQARKETAQGQMVLF